MMAINESIKLLVFESTLELLTDALENGDVMETMDELRESIRQGWMDALNQIDTPKDVIDFCKL